MCNGTYGSNQLKGLVSRDLSCSFKVGMRVENDVLLRCRHYKSESERVSMFRLVFHTSFVSHNLLRFTKALLRVTSLGNARRHPGGLPLPRRLLC